MMVDLPRVFYTTCYVAAGLLFLVAEGLALLDPDRGDTLTEHVRGAIQASSLLGFLLSAFALWLIWHFLVEGR